MTKLTMRNKLSRWGFRPIQVGFHAQELSPAGQIAITEGFGLN